MASATIFFLLIQCLTVQAWKSTLLMTSVLKLENPANPNSATYPVYTFKLDFQREPDDDATRMTGQVTLKTIENGVLDKEILSYVLDRHTHTGIWSLSRYTHLFKCDSSDDGPITGNHEISGNATHWKAVIHLVFPAVCNRIDLWQKGIVTATLVTTTIYGFGHEYKKTNSIEIAKQPPPRLPSSGGGGGGGSGGRGSKIPMTYYIAGAAGLGVCILLVVALLVYCLWWRRRKSNSTVTDDSTKASSESGDEESGSSDESRISASSWGS